MDGARLVRLGAKRGALPANQAAKCLALLKRGTGRPERLLVDAGALTDEALRPLLREIRSGLPPGTPHAFERFLDRLLAKVIDQAGLAPRPQIDALLASPEAAAGRGEGRGLVFALVASGLMDEEAAFVALESFRASVIVCPGCFARYDRAGIAGTRVRCASCRGEIVLAPAAVARPPGAKVPVAARSQQEKRRLVAESQKAASLVAREATELAIPIPRVAGTRSMVLGIVLVLGAATLIGMALALAFPAAPTPATPVPPTSRPMPPDPPALALPEKVPAAPPFEEVRSRASSLVAAGEYARARALLEPLLRSQEEDAPAAARAELEAITKLEGLAAEAQSLTRAVDLAPGLAHEDAVVRLSAWWRGHLDDRGLAPVARVTARLEAERRTRLARLAAGAAERLEAARARIALEHSKPLAPDTWGARQELARAASARKPLTAWVPVAATGKTVTAKGLVVTRLDARGFALASQQQQLEATFADRPELALEILALARRQGEERARDLRDDARIALSLALEDAALALFQEHAALVPGTGLPDVAALRSARPFVAALEAPQDDGTRVLRFRLDRESGARDFAIAGAAKGEGGRLGTKDGALVVEGGAPGGFAWLARRLEVDPGPVTLEGEVDAAETAPFLGLELEAEDRTHSLLDVSVEQGQAVRVGFLVVKPAKAGEPAPAAWKDLARLELPRKTGRVLLRLVATPGTAPRVFVNGTELALGGAPALPAAITLTPRLGKQGGPRASFRKLTLVVPFRASWLARLEDEHARLLATELAKAEPPRASATEPPAPAPSAEDRVELAGIPPLALAAYAEARAALAKKDEKAARAALDRATLEGAPFPAALILRARLERNPARALADLDQALAFLPGCPEALAQRALVSAKLGYPDRASADLDAALAARSDLALAYQARGTIGFARRNPEIAGDAREAALDMELALALAPDDVLLARETRAARKLVSGPWGEGKEKRTLTDHFVLRTDTEARTGAAVATALEDAWQVFARAFPPPASWRRAEVLVFGARPDYLDWAEAFEFELGAVSAGFYDPVHDSLMLYEAAWDRTLEHARCVTVHEAFHQYARRVLPPLPDWLDEGLAESFGIEVVGGKSREHAPHLRQCLLEPGGSGRESWRSFVNGSYEDFHDKAHGGKARSQNYARAWIVATLLREGSGDFAGILPLLLEKARAGPLTPEVLRSVFDDAKLDALDRAFRVRAQASSGE